jgi:hypothetical protein
MPTVEQLGVIIPLIIAALSFAWGVYQYFHNDRVRQAQLASERMAETERIKGERKAEAERRRIEATRPFLERQLELYSEASRAAASIASGDPTVKAEAIVRFRMLYCGELAMVEDRGVETAMKAFSDALREGLTDEDLGEYSVNLAHACRESLAKSWNTKAWQSHYEHPPTSPGNTM